MSTEIIRQGPVRMTKGAVDAAWKARAPGRRVVIADNECRGLALVVHPTSMTWRFDYKPRGLDAHTGKRFASRSVTIGNPQTHSPDEARDEANKLKGQAKAGADPAAERKVKIASDARKRGHTMRRLLEDYEKALPRRAKLRGSAGKLSVRAANGELGYLRAAIALMNAMDKPVEAITVADMKRVLNAVSDKPATARHMYGAMSRFFEWVQDEGAIAANPCLLVAKAHRPKPVKSRHVFHTLQQLAQLWVAIEKAEGLMPVHRDILRLLIAVPCRRGEAARMTWSDLDLKGGIWSQPDTETKNGDPHRFYLPPLALDILKRRHKDSGEPREGLVFPSPRAGKPIDTFAKAKKSIDAALPTKIDWRMHDHRRSFVTALAEAGAQEALLDAILNHRQSATRGGVLGTYQRATRWPEQVELMKKWDELLESAFGQKGGTNDNG